MFNIGFSELIIILIVTLLVVGPNELPKVARSLAKTINELKKSRAEIEKAILEDPLEKTPEPHNHAE